MTIERIQESYRAQPLKPFLIYLADGREIPVLSHDFIMAVPSGRTIIVCQPDDRVNMIDLLRVTDLKYRSLENGHAKRRRKS
jgi:hypothetical protein